MKYSSYYTYQKYCNIGGQGMIPVYPNVYSIDADETLQKRLHKKNNGCCSDLPAIYRWVNLDPTIEGNYFCSGTTKCYEQQKQVSYDNGETWENVIPAEYQPGEPYEYQSADCGYATRTVSGSPYCSGETGYDKYIDVYYQVSSDSGETWTTTATTPTLVEQNSSYCGYVPPHEFSGDYLTFIALEDGTFSFRGGVRYSPSSSMQNAGNIRVSYSLDSGSTWTELSGITENSAESISTPTIESGQIIMWKNSLSTYGVGYEIGTFRSTGKFNVYGNILSMRYGDNFRSYDRFTFAYQGGKMFSGCTELISAENLILAKYNNEGGCYQLFEGCTSLTTAPVLPTNLNIACYFGMFENCTSLTTAPILSATTLSGNCYTRMFSGCTSLTTVQNALPARKFVTGCYGSMFAGCTSLTTAPEISANTFVTDGDLDGSQCCISMFRGCSSLVTPPSILLPTTFRSPYVSRCYESMFAGCTSLTTAPVLPATELSNSCYSEMFADCTSLTTAPDLPATTLVSKCYFGMFSGCTSLNYIKCLGTNKGSSYNYTTYWVKGVARNGTFVKTSGSTWTNAGYNDGIPPYWTVQDAT